MIIEEKDLDPLAERLRKKGLTEERAKRVVHGYFNATLEVLEEGEEIPLLGSKALYVKKSKDSIKIYPRS